MTPAAGTGERIAGGGAVELARGARAPDFYIVGHPKSGTTAMYEMLRMHPGIFMPELKETRFFAGELHPGTRGTWPYPSTIEEYLELFAPARPGQRVGEASPSYLRSAHAARRIAELRPDARIIAILREPASFLHSLYLELVKDRVEPETEFARALEREAGDVPDLAPGLVYAEYVRYVEQLRRYHQTFGERQVLVLIYDDFRNDNEATLRGVLDFLDVGEPGAIEPVDANTSVRIRSLRLNELVHSLSMGRGAGRPLRAAIKALTPQRARRAALAKLRRRVLYAEPQAPDPALMERIRRRFAPEVQALSEYLDRDLVGLWGYDQLDR